MTSRRRPTSSERVLAALLAWCAFASFSFVLLGAVVRGTVLEQQWYQEALDEADAYDRVYTEVLADPELRDTVENLLANTPVSDTSIVSANLRLVLPPQTLREFVDGLIVELIGFLGGDTTDVRPDLLLEPIVRNLERVASVFTADLVASLEEDPAVNLADLDRKVDEFAADLSAGRVPDGLPDFALTPDQAATVSEIVLDPVPNPPPDLRSQVEAALVAGDLDHALALVGPFYLEPQTTAAARELRQQAGGDSIDVLALFDGSDDLRVQVRGDTPDDGFVFELRGMRELMGVRLPLGMAAGLFVFAGALLGLAALRRSQGRSWVPSVAAVLLVSGGLWSLAYFAFRWFGPDPLASVADGLPAGSRGVFVDVTDNLWHGLDVHVLGVSLLALAPALLLVAGGALALVARSTRRSPVARRALVAVAAAAIGLAALAVAPVRIPGAAAQDRECNGRAELCDRPLDEVAFAATHNAMGATDYDFLGPDQDVTFTAQLDLGVRALLLDAWYWESPERFEEQVDELPPNLVPLARGAIARANPYRPGTFLCHQLCRMGWVELADGLREIRQWLDRNPNEVLLIIVEDYISEADFATAMRASGLRRHVYEHPEGADWPALGTLVDRDTRLVLWSEKHGDAYGWYPNFERDWMETPFSNPSPDAMTCEPNRGGTDKPLFLLNNWVQRAAASRADAQIVNDRTFVVRRARACAAARGQPVNAVAVDFVNIGETVAAVDVLNASGQE